MKAVLTSVATMLMLVAFSNLASASLYLAQGTPYDGGGAGTLADPLRAILTGGDTSQDTINTLIAGTLGASIELYKQDVPPKGGSKPADTGAFAASYNTDFFNAPDDPADATLSYVSGPKFSNPTHLLVKGGGPAFVAPLWYLFDISSWDATMDIVMSDFWPDQGAISHVTIYGSTGVVPEPASLLVWGGLACAGICVARRRTRN